MRRDSKSTACLPFIDQQSGSGTGGGRKRAQLRRAGKGQENLGRAATGAEGSGRGKKRGVVVGCEGE